MVYGYRWANLGGHEKLVKPCRLYGATNHRTTIMPGKNALIYHG